MPKKNLLPAVAALMAALAIPSEAGAWGGYHVGYTHVGPSGVYHAGRTGYAGRYGDYRGGSAHYSGYGGYHAGYGGYHAGYGGYHYGGGGYHYGYHW